MQCRLGCLHDIDYDSDYGGTYNIHTNPLTMINALFRQQKGKCPMFADLTTSPACLLNKGVLLMRMRTT